MKKPTRLRWAVGMRSRELDA